MQDKFKSNKVIDESFTYILRNLMILHLQCTKRPESKQRICKKLDKTSKADSTFTQHSNTVLGCQNTFRTVTVPVYVETLNT